jgi:hypothetical protein
LAERFGALFSVRERLLHQTGTGVETGPAEIIVATMKEEKAEAGPYPHASVCCHFIVRRYFALGIGDFQLIAAKAF